MAVLVTGVAGSIGYHVAAALAARGEAVIGVTPIGVPRFVDWYRGYASV